MNDQPDISIRLLHWEMEAKRVIEAAEADGVIITVERRSVNPLSPKMREHIAHIEAREKR